MEWAAFVLFRTLNAVEAVAQMRLQNRVPDVGKKIAAATCHCHSVLDLSRGPARGRDRAKENHSLP